MRATSVAQPRIIKSTSATITDPRGLVDASSRHGGKDYPMVKCKVPARGSPRRKRRRPGELWNLWRVEGRNTTTGEAVAIGYLVTTGKRFPDPVAFIPTTDRVALEMALKVMNGKLDPAAFGWGFSDAGWEKRFSRLFGMLLIPIDSAGRAITRDPRYAAAQFVGSYHLEGGAEFRLFSHRYLQTFRRCRFKSVESPESNRYMLTKKSGAPETSNAAQPASKSSKGMRLATAA